MFMSSPFEPLTALGESLGLFLDGAAFSAGGDGAIGAAGAGFFVPAPKGDRNSRGGAAFSGVVAMDVPVGIGGVPMTDVGDAGDTA